jgi:acyl-lipid omega-6 desaturase (Delta-12 desaturase)
MTQSTQVESDLIIKQLSEFQKPSTGRSLWQLANSFIPYLVLWYAAYRVLEYSFWLTLPILILAAGFLIRLFIISHDCGHGSFFKSKRANNIVGTITGILTFTPYYYWRTNHARHHATSANLDDRGYGDVWMMTVDEYLHSPLSTRIKYRLYRNPFVMFFLGPLLVAFVSHRLILRQASLKERLSTYGTNGAILVIAVVLSYVMGVKAYLLIQLPVLYLSLIAGIWLFYVQHQFEGVYWARQKEWNYFLASFQGGSFYDLPIILRWFTGSIGYHHIHHLNSRIPNYNLAKCHKQITATQAAPRIRLFSSLRSLRFRLWDETKSRLVGFGQLKQLQRNQPGKS